MNKIKLIKDIIQAELKGDLTISNLHGIDLSRCLVDPYLETLEDSFAEGETIDMYVVLKEHPDSEDGYQIVYDPAENMFGLSILGKSTRRVFLGFDGTFLEALEGM
jgi:hypothetical protein